MLDKLLDLMRLDPMDDDDGDIEEVTVYHVEFKENSGLFDRLLRRPVYIKTDK